MQQKSGFGRKHAYITITEQYGYFVLQGDVQNDEFVIEYRLIDKVAAAMEYMWLFQNVIG